MYDSLLEIWAGLKRNKLRTALTGLSVSVGIFLLIVLLGAGNGLIHAFENNSGQWAMDLVRVWPGMTSRPYGGLESGREIKFDRRDIELSGRDFPDRVTAVGAQNSQSGVTVVNGTEVQSASFTGVFPDYRDMSRVKLLAGRYINRPDLVNSRKVMVIGEKAARELFGSADKAVGKMLKADGNMFRVIGIYSDRGQWGSMEAHVPFTTLQTIYNKGKDVQSLMLRVSGVDGEESSEAFNKDYRRALAARHCFDPEDDRAVWLWNTSVGAKESAMAMGMLRKALWIVGLFTLLSGVVGISNIMLITVKERTREFGIRKALGARPASILRSVLLESVIITAFFGYVGLVAGVAATEYMNVVAGSQTVKVAGMEMEVFKDPTVDMPVALQALAVLVAAGLVAGFVPARKAVRVKPVEALNAR